MWKEKNEPEAHRSRTEAGHRAMIYVVDDEPMLLELATVILEPLGYEVAAFRDPELALRSFAAAQPGPDVIVTDYAMHSMNGLALLNACRRIRPQQKVLLVSGTVEENIYQGAAQRPDAFLAKPYEPKELAEAVAALLTT